MAESPDVVFETVHAMLISVYFLIIVFNITHQYFYMMNFGCVYRILFNIQVEVFLTKVVLCSSEDHGCSLI
jgi:hypothetical protein